MTRPSISTAPSSQPVNNQSSADTNGDLQNQMIIKFSQESGMNIDYSKL